jgi:hypothetical protein
MTNLEYCCERFNYQGGTIHQFAEKLGLDVEQILNMSQHMLKTIIDNYITNSIPEKIKALQDKEDLIISLGGIQAMMTGVAYIKVNKKYFTTLVYTDQLQESKQLSKNVQWENVFSIVSAVQSE